MTAPREARFPRSSRLKLRKLLRPLFRRGGSQTVAAGCVRLLFRRVSWAETAVPVQVAFVPGRQPNSVTRNRVRRALREVYRVHQGGLVDLFALPERGALTVAVLFRSVVDADLHARVAADMPRALERLVKALRAEDSHN